MKSKRTPSQPRYVGLGLVLLLLLGALLWFMQPSLEPASESRSSRLQPLENGAPLQLDGMPEYIDHADIAVKAGALLWHITNISSRPSPQAGDKKWLVVEGYVANYTDKEKTLFDYHLPLRYGAIKAQSGLQVGDIEVSPDADAMAQVQPDLNRDYVGRDIPLLARLTAKPFEARQFFAVYVVPSDQYIFRLGFKLDQEAYLDLLLAPKGENQHTYEVIKLADHARTFYTLSLSPLVNPKPRSVERAVLPPQKLENCTNQTSSLEYTRYEQKKERKLESVELNLSVASLPVVLSPFVTAGVELSLVGLNYRYFDSEEELFTFTEKITISVPSRTLFTYVVTEQEMQTEAILTLHLHGTSAEIPITIIYSELKTRLDEKTLADADCQR
jgi:hypothetical protein